MLMNFNKNKTTAQYFINTDYKHHLQSVSVSAMWNLFNHWMTANKMYRVIIFPSGNFYASKIFCSGMYVKNNLKFTSFHRRNMALTGTANKNSAISRKSDCENMRPYLILCLKIVLSVKPL